MADAIALIDDLFFLAKVHETAKHTGVTLETAANGEQLLKAAAGSPAALILVDLNASQGALDAVEQLCWRRRGERARQPAARDRVSIPCAGGFGGTGARGGVHEVMPRSKFTQNLAEISARSEIVKSRVSRQ